MTRAHTLLVVFSLTLTACEPGIITNGELPNYSVTLADGGNSPTWAQDVAPLMSKNCGGCHVAGGIAPFALTTYAQSAPMAKANADAVKAKRMPPWMPGRDSPELIHNRALHDKDIAMLVSWANTGALEGDTAHPAPLVPPDMVQLGTPDVTADMGLEYTPDATLSDDYRCFLIPLGTTETRVASAFEVLPGNRASVHHVIVSLFNNSDLAELQRIDAASNRPGTPNGVSDGWTCFGGPVPQSSTASTLGDLGAWVPGVAAVELPLGTGINVPSGAIAVMQVHYNLAGSHAPDRTKLNIRFAPKAQESQIQLAKQLRMLKLGLKIPAGSMGHDETISRTAQAWSSNRFYLDANGYIFGVAGHMHTRGTRFLMTLTRGSQTQTLLDIPAWDFHWQGSYTLKTPIEVRPTDTIAVTCTFDNPGNTELHWGENTTDEMCIGYAQMVDQPIVAPVP